jgi:hypothetical protein
MWAIIEPRAALYLELRDFLRHAHFAYVNMSRDVLCSSYEAYVDDSIKTHPLRANTSKIAHLPQ